MATTEDFRLQHKKAKLEGLVWLAENAKANVCLIHGFGEHINRYHHVAEVFNANGLNLFAIDLIGHGKSEGRRGNIKSFDTYLEETDMLIEYASSHSPRLPIFLYGHSMGGCIVSKYLLAGEVDKLNGALITSPWLKLETPAPKIKVVMGKFLLKLGINITEKADLEPDNLSRDLDIGKAYVEDPLVHDKISAKAFIQITEAGEWILTHTSRSKLPLLIAHGEADKITSYQTTKSFAEKAGSMATFKSWPELRHETHNETNKKEVIEFYTNWLTAQLS